MHLEIDAVELHKTLIIMSKITDKAKDTHQLVLLKAADGVLQCQATNGVVFAKQSIAASVAKDGDALVSCSKLASLTKGITTPVTLKLSSNHLLVTSSNSKCKLAVTDPNNFSTVSFENTRHLLDVHKKPLLSGLNKLSFLTKSKIQNPSLDGVAIVSNEVGTCLFSSDSIKLAQYAIPNTDVVRKDGATIKLTIPSQALSVGIIKALFDTSDNETPISLYLSDKLLVLKADNCLVATSVSSLPFPEVSHLFQQSDTSKITVNRSDMYMALSRIVTVADSVSAIISLTITNGRITLTSASSSDEAEEHLECDYSGEDMSFKVRASDITCYQSGMDQVVLELQDKRVVVTDNHNYKLSIPKCV